MAEGKKMERKLVDITDLDIFNMTDEDVAFEIKHREPTEAIPVKWLEQWFYENITDYCYAKFDVLIEDWRKENDKR